MPYSARAVFGGGSRPAAVEIDKTRFDTLTLARRQILTVIEMEETFNIFADSVADFEREQLCSALDDNVYPDRGYSDYHLERLTLTRRATTVLATGGSYFDRACKNLTALYGRDARKADRVRELEAEQEKDPGYGLVAELRNFAIHRGHPINSISYHFDYEDQEALTGPRTRVMFNLNASSVPENDDLSRVLQTLLPKLERDRHGRIPLKKPFRRYAAGIGAIHDTLRSDIAADVATWEGQLFDCLADFDQGKTAVRIAELDNSGNETEGGQHVFLDMLQYRKLLSRRVRLAGLDRVHVSGAA